LSGKIFLDHVEESARLVVEMMLDATQKFKTKLTAERVFGWQASRRAAAT
jgi:hypothetical protein